MMACRNSKEDVDTPFTPPKSTEDYIKEYLAQLEYVDLGLPSGTLWSEDLDTYAIYGQEQPDPYRYDKYTWGTIQCYQSEYYDMWKDALPSQEQMEELICYCQWKYVVVMDQGGFEGIGPNGNTIMLGCEDQTDGHWNKNLFYGYYWGAYKSGPYRCIYLNYLHDHPESYETWDPERSPGRVRLVKKQ